MIWSLLRPFEEFKEPFSRDLRIKDGGCRPMFASVWTRFIQYHDHDLYYKSSFVFRVLSEFRTTGAPPSVGVSQSKRPLSLSRGAGKGRGSCDSASFMTSVAKVANSSENF